MTVSSVLSGIVRKTNYQKNLEIPEPAGKWYAGDMPTTREVYARIYTISKTDREKAKRISDGFMQEQANPNSLWYDPYLAPTSNSIKYEGQTQKAEQEWAAVQEEINYWTNRTDLNLSDDEIYRKVHGDKFATKYPTLAKMDGDSIVNLNRVIGYSDDNMYTAIWRARNNGGTGDWRLDTAKSTVGQGNFWQDNPEITAKLNYNDPENFSPYEVGMTADDVGLYFGVSSLNRETLNEIGETPHWEDKTWSEMYRAADEAVTNWENLTSEETELYKDIDNLLKTYSDPKVIAELVQQKDTAYKDLFALDQTLWTNGRYGKNYKKLIPTSGPVSYRWSKVEQYINDKCAEKTENEGVASFINGFANGVQNAEKTAPEAAKTVEEQKPAGIDAFGLAFNTLGAFVSNALGGGKEEKPVTQPDVSPTEEAAPSTQKDVNEDPIGQFGKGNIDLWNLPVVQNEDGSVSTVESMSFYDADEDKEILVPTVINGEHVSQDEAEEHYYETGEYLGKFDTTEEADEYAQQLHEQQENMYAQPEAEEPEVNVPEVTPTPAPVISEAEQAQEKAAHEQLTDLEPVVQQAGTADEKLAMLTGMTSLFERGVNIIQAWKSNFAEDMYNKLIGEIDTTYLDAVRGSLEYEGHQQNREDAVSNLERTEEEWTKLDERRKYYDAASNLSEEEFQKLTGVVQAKEWDYFHEVLSNPPSEGAQRGEIDNYEAALIWLCEQVDPNYELTVYERGGDWEEVLEKGQEYWSALQPVVGERKDVETGNGRVKHIVGTGKMSDTPMPLSEEEQERYDVLTAYRNEQQEKIASEDEWLASNEESYKGWQTDMNTVSMLAKFTELSGANVNSTLLPSINYLFKAAQNDGSIARSPYFYLDAAVANGEMTKEAAIKEATTNSSMYLNSAQVLEDTVAFLEDNGIWLGEDGKKAMSMAKSLRHAGKAASYVSLDGRADFDKMIAKGKEAAANDKGNAKLLTYFGVNVPDYGTQEYYELIGELTPANAIISDNKNQWSDILRNITEEEVNRYFYLYGKDGKEAADNYLAFINDPEYGELNIRSAMSWDERRREFGSRGPLEALLAGGASLLTKPLDVAGAVGYQLAGGSNPYSPFMLKQSTGLREGTKEWAKSVFGDNFLTNQGADALFGIGDIVMGSKLFSWLGSFANTFYLSADAATNTYQNVLMRTNGDTEEANKQSIVSMFTDMLSRAFTIKGVNKILEGNIDPLASKFAQITEKVFTNAGAVGAATWGGEKLKDAILNDLLELKSTERSDIVQKYKDMDYSDSMAEEAADAEMNELFINRAVNATVNTIFRDSILGIHSVIKSKGGYKQLGRDAKKLANSAKMAAQRGMNQLFPEQGEDIVLDTEGATILDENGNPVGMPVSGYIGNGENSEPLSEEPANLTTGVLPPETSLEQMEKDNTLLMSTYTANPTATSVVVSSVLGTDKSVPSAIAAGQKYVGEVAGGDTKMAAQSLQSLLLNGAKKDEIIYATLTGGAGRQALDRAIARIANGETLTPIDVKAIHAGLVADRKADPKGFNNSFKAAVKQSMIANKTLEIMRQNNANKQTDAAKKSVEAARTTLNNATEIAENAHAKLATDGENLRNIPLDLPDQFSQAAAKVVHTNELATQADQNVEIAQNKLDQAQENAASVNNEAMATARAEAIPTVEQQIEENEAASYENGVTQLQPLRPFGQSIEVYNTQGMPVRITGVYDMPDDVTVFTTEDGRLVTDVDRLLPTRGVNGTVGETIVTFHEGVEVSDDFAIQNAIDRMFGEWVTGSGDLRQTNRPAAYFPNSFIGTVNGQPVHMIGLAGKEVLNGIEYPVIMDINGNLYSTDDEAVVVPFNNQDSVDETFDNYADRLEPVDVQRITGGDVNEAEGRNVETGSAGEPVQGAGGEGNNEGQLPSASGRDDGQRDNGDAGSDGGQGTDGRYQESPAEDDGSGIRRDSEGLVRPDKPLTRYSVRTLKSKGASDLRLKYETDSQKFSDNLKSAKDSNTHGAYVDNQSTEELAEKGAIMITSASGLAGAAVGTTGSEKGNIFGVYKSKRSKAKKASAPLIISAVGNGGNKLDCFDGNLRTLYASVGFMPVSRVPFNREYAPEGWNYERDGEPDVVAWMLRPGENAGTIVEKYGLREEEGGYHLYSDEEIAALPVFSDYGMAMEYRDNVLANGGKIPDEDAPTLEKLMGKPVSEEFLALQNKLLAGEEFTEDDVNALYDTDEIQYALRYRDAGDSLDRAVIKAAKKAGGDWVAAVEAQLPAEQVQMQHDIIAELDKQGSAVIDSDGKVSYTGPIQHGKRVDMLLGPAASGKSTIADRISQENGSRFYDADQVKALHPNYKGGINEDYIHVESTFINDERILKAAESGENVILQSTGENMDSLMAKLQVFKDAGYEIHIHMTSLPKNKSLGRALSRFVGTGRYHDFKHLMKADPEKVKENFDILKGDEGISGYANWNTDVPRNELPIPIEYSDNREIEIFGGGAEPLGREPVLAGTLPERDAIDRNGTPSWSDNGGSGGGLTTQGDVNTPTGLEMADGRLYYDGTDIGTYQPNVDGSDQVLIYDTKARNNRNIDKDLMDQGYKFDPLLSDDDKDVFTRPSTQTDVNGSSTPRNVSDIMNRYGLTPSDHEGIPNMTDLTDSNGDSFGYTYMDKNGNNVIGLSDKYNTPETTSMLKDAGYEYNPTADEWVQKPITQSPVNARPLTGAPVASSTTTTQTPVSGPQRQFGSRTAQESNALHQQVKDYLHNNSGYTPDTNDEQIDRAVSWVESHITQADPEGFYGALAEAESDGFNPNSADGQARMLVLMSMAATNNDVNAETRIADLYNIQGTNLGQALQARKIFRLMTPSGRKETLQREARKIEEEYRRRGKKGLKLKISDETLNAAANARSEKEFEDARRKMEGELAAQIPSDWRLKARTWRMASMLLNPRTHIRNLEGNAVFILPMSMKNGIAAALEKVTKVPVGERTKSVTRSKEAIEFAERDAELMKPVLQGTAKYFEVGAVEANRKAFGTKNNWFSRTVGKGIQKLADWNGDLLEKEDWISLNRHYKHALASYMTANGYTEADMKGDVLKKAREYAVQEAQKATYRDANKMAKWFNDQSNKPAAAQFILNAVMPFTKTPMNIVKRGVEYSPFGLVYSLATAKRQLEAYKDWEESGFEGKKPVNAKSPSEVLDRISAGLTGTMLAGLGAWLASLGFLKVKASDADKRKGSQDYSLEIGGKSFGIGNMLPTVLPILFGGSVYEEVAKLRDGEADIGSVLQAIGNMIQPSLETTMFMSWQNLLETGKYTNYGDVTTSVLAQKILANYASSFVPSIVGATARVVDPTRRKAYVESGDTMSTWTALGEQVENKLPFLSMNNVPYLDKWGEQDVENPQVGEYFMAFLKNFILPDEIKSLSDSKLDDMLDEITRETGMNIEPDMTSEKKITVNGESIKLNDKQWYQYSSSKGKYSKDTLQELIERPEFIVMNPEVQANLVKKVYKYAKAKAALELFPEKNITDGWTKGALTADNVIDYIFEKEEESARNASNDSHRESLYTAIKAGDIEAAKVDIELLHQGGVEDSSIKNSITRKYKPLYKEAFDNGDYDEMVSITNILRGLGLGYENYDFTKWQK